VESLLLDERNMKMTSKRTVLAREVTGRCSIACSDAASAIERFESGKTQEVMKIVCGKCGKRFKKIAPAGKKRARCPRCGAINTCP
jgi:hypothetical protein